MTTRRVLLASLVFVVLLASFSVLPGQPTPRASARQRRATQETPQFGRIEISTTPGGYPLSIDGQPAGTTAASVRSIDLAPGRHAIAVEFPGGQRWTRTLSVRGGQKICISLAYRPSPPGGRQGDITASVVNCGELSADNPPTPETEPSIILRSRQRQQPSPTPAGTPPQPTPAPADADPPIIIQGGDDLPSEPDKPEVKKVERLPDLPAATPLPLPQTAQETPQTTPPTAETTRARTQSQTPQLQRTEPVKPQNETEPPENKDYTVVPIFYGTDRARTGKKEPRDFYGAERGKLEMGTCDVSIPKTHVRGQLEAPSIWRLEFKEDPKLHVVLLGVKPLAAGEFNSQFQRRLGEAKSRDVFVFVHGYNVKFVDAARRTAQLSYDLEFPGVPVLYSWPSQGTLSGYVADENEVIRTEPHLKKFLANLTAQANGARIHLVAHSMGNRAVIRVLQLLAAENSAPLFGEVILTAPDVDAETLREVAPEIKKVAHRITLYASSKDAALVASKEAHGGKYHRAGDSFPEIVIVPDIDSIDASGIDTDMLGHTYFAQMKVVMDDINQLMIAGKLPAERSLLEQIKEGGKYWRLPGAIVATDNTRPDIIPGARYLTLRNALIFAVLFVVFVAVAVWLVLRARRRRAAAAVAA